MGDDGNHLPIHLIEESFDFFLHVVFSDIDPVYAIFHDLRIFKAFIRVKATRPGRQMAFKAPLNTGRRVSIVQG